MTMLDERARSAAEAVHQSVADYRPATAMPVLVRRHTIWQGMQWATAGIGAVVLIALIALVTAPTDGDVADTTVPQVTTTVTTVTPTTIVEEQGPSRDPVPTTAPQVAPPPAAEAPTTTTVAADLEAPLLQIISPAPDSHFTTSLVTFAGRTEPGATVIASGRFPVTVAADGTWSIDLVIFSGKNGASFAATDAAGNTSTASVAVWLDVEEPKDGGKEEPPPPPEFTFSASATYGSCELDPPYDVYYGTAKPGTTVAVSSPYGSGSAVADAEGNWEAQVFFPSAPYNETFLVTITEHTGAKKKFEFVSLVGG